ncbi:hypothetical protein [Nostoc sp.]|uniref:hypothetical protein n=1 Tax=Nostoc sp. TaxID=1180 RepID=UPI003FA5521C
MVLPRQANLGYGYRLESDAHQTGFGHYYAVCYLLLSVDRRENKGFVVKNRLVPQGGSQKSKVKSQKCYGISLLGIFNGCSIYAALY